jgi:hypothetical protein
MVEFAGGESKDSDLLLRLVKRLIHIIVFYRLLDYLPLLKLLRRLLHLTKPETARICFRFADSGQLGRLQTVLRLEEKSVPQRLGFGSWAWVV